MKKKIKIFFVKLQLKILYAWKVFHYPKDTILTINGEQVGRWRFIRYGWGALDDLSK